MSMLSTTSRSSGSIWRCPQHKEIHEIPVETPTLPEVESAVSAKLKPARYHPPQHSNKGDSEHNKQTTDRLSRQRYFQGTRWIPT